MDGVRIVSQEVNEMASQLQQFNGQLRTCLDGISAKMRQLDLSWDSPAGAALQARFTELLPVFDRYEQVVEQYVSFLRQSLHPHQDAESLLRQPPERVAECSSTTPVCLPAAAGMPPSLSAAAGGQ